MTCISTGPKFAPFLQQLIYTKLPAQSMEAQPDKIKKKLVLSSDTNKMSQSHKRFRDTHTISRINEQTSTFVRQASESNRATSGS